MLGMHGWGGGCVGEEDVAMVVDAIVGLFVRFFALYEVQEWANTKSGRVEFFTSVPNRLNKF